MTDLLVPLYNLPEEPVRVRDVAEGIVIRRALAPEMHIICKWIENEFSQGWASEAGVAMNGLPVRLWVAIKEQEILGFACFDAIAKGFFGPTGVAARYQGKGLGGELLLATLRGMRDAGYGYGVIGSVSSSEFYSKYLNIIEIPDSSPGIYKGLLKSKL